MQACRSFLWFAIFLLPAGFVSGAGLSPWQFGMSKEQVANFKQSGPYKTFQNGDLETYSGIYHGHKENVQFFFRNDRLVRIGVYLGETTDRHKAVAAFRRMYGILEKDYGKIEVPEVHDAPGSKANPDVTSIAAAMNADLFGKSRAIPARQPKDVQVQGQIFAGNAQGKRWFYVAIFFDPR